jgi:hypothetical protein
LKGTQGKLQEKDCEDQILNVLLNAPREGLITARILERLEFSGKTIYKYLRDLHKVKKWIDYVDSKPEFGKIESPLCLTAKGKQEIVRRNFIRGLEKLKADYANDFIMSYKVNLMSLWIGQLFRFDFTPEAVNSPEFFDQTLVYDLANPKKRKTAESVVEIIENRLRFLGYTEQDIFALWLIDNSFIIHKILAVFGPYDWLDQLPFKATINPYNYSEEAKKEAFKEIRKEIDKYIIRSI